MTVKLAMFEASHAPIGDRLAALQLDLDLHLFDEEGKFHRGQTPPEEVDVDYLWFSQALSAGGHMKMAFDLALRLKSLDVLQTFNAGLDHPAYAKISARGARISNSSAQGVAIAEYTFGQVMALFHPIETQRRQQADKVWAKTPHREISRTHWLIVGYGPIGQAIATRAKAFGADVSVIRRSPDASGPVDRAGTLADAEAFASDADVIVIAASANDQTKGFFGEGFFQAVKPGAIIVNVARGSLIDDGALLAALDRGQIETAVLDVFHEEPLPSDHPLWDHPKVRVTPHTSFAGDGVADRWDQLFIDEIQRYARGEPLARVVDPADI